jgi:hypothetical protein
MVFKKKQKKTFEMFFISIFLLWIRNLTVLSVILRKRFSVCFE